MTTGDEEAFMREHLEIPAACDQALRRLSNSM